MQRHQLAVGRGSYAISQTFGSASARKMKVGASADLPYPPSICRPIIAIAR